MFYVHLLPGVLISDVAYKHPKSLNISKTNENLFFYAPKLNSAWFETDRRRYEITPADLDSKM